MKRTKSPAGYTPIKTKTDEKMLNELGALRKKLAPGLDTGMNKRIEHLFTEVVQLGILIKSEDGKKYNIEYTEDKNNYICIEFPTQKKH